MALIYSAKSLAGGLATIALAGSGIGIGNVFASPMIATAMNPNMKEQFFTYAILGFAPTEAIALFGLMMAFLILSAMQGAMHLSNAWME